MPDIDLLSDLVRLLDKYDPEVCARLASRLAHPDFLPKLLDLLRVLSARPTAETVQQTRESQESAYTRQRDKLLRRTPRPEPTEDDVFDTTDDVAFARHFQALKGYQGRGKAPDSSPLRDDEQIIK